jgi:uncharacterized protein YdeI (YjbR/CyaY-like superfamily)
VDVTEKKEPAVKAFATAAKFEAWLAKHHADTADGIWLRMFKKGTAKKTITYAEAVEVALCYGWIDGQGKSEGEQSHIQRFTPRRKRSMWSQLNRDRVARLIAAGRMQPAGQHEIDRAKADGRWDNAYAPPSTMQPPPEFLERLARNKKARAFYGTLDRRNTYAIAHRLHTAKKPETRTRRIEQIVEMLARGEKFY